MKEFPGIVAQPGVRMRLPAGAGTSIKVDREGQVVIASVHRHDWRPYADGEVFCTSAWPYEDYPHYDVPLFRYQCVRCGREAIVEEADRGHLPEWQL